MAETAAALHGMEAGAKEAAIELLDVVFDWILPIITLIVGYIVSAGIGLSGALGTAIDGALGATGLSQTVLAYIADFAAILIWGTIGGGMWSVAKRFDGKYAGYILRPLATFFFGLALGEIPALVGGKVNNGTIGAAVTKLASGG